jgi:hypothetical protein
MAAANFANCRSRQQRHSSRKVYGALALRVRRGLHQAVWICQDSESSSDTKGICHAVVTFKCVLAYSRVTVPGSTVESGEVPLEARKSDFRWVGKAMRDSVRVLPMRQGPGTRKENLVK